MEKDNATQKSKTPGSSEPKKRGRKKMSFEEAMQSREKSLIRAIKRYGEECKKDEEQAKKETD